jgi:hypothetical protein
MKIFFEKINYQFLIINTSKRKLNPIKSNPIRNERNSSTNSTVFTHLDFYAKHSIFAILVLSLKLGLFFIDEWIKG